MCPCIGGLFGMFQTAATMGNLHTSKGHPKLCAKYTCLSVLGCHDFDGLSSFWFKGIQAFSDSCSCMITIFFYLLLVGSLLGSAALKKILNLFVLSHQFGLKRLYLSWKHFVISVPEIQISKDFMISRDGIRKL
ncbi:hypothetical protein NC653_029784 [Populus alba x Populus x berolinensis]|uniref:Uncharacterized protein n=1 Tax=Populus alba x Populus x berolinensis TaxID=444605 RepID=A0AAD6Q5N1_9ROSI|nr:hypothetical protein NC653_029784 [Populus alba x Populus x berolinensis]